MKIKIETKFTREYGYSVRMWADDKEHQAALAAASRILTGTVSETISGVFTNNGQEKFYVFGQWKQFDWKSEENFHPNGANLTANEIWQVIQTRAARVRAWVNTFEAKETTLEVEI